MNNKIIGYSLLVALIVVPVVLFILPGSFFDTGTSICPSMLLFQTECPGCGMTRGVMHLLHFDLENALYYNMLSVIVLPAMIWVWFIFVKRSLNAIKTGAEIKI